MKRILLAAVIILCLLLSLVACDVPAATPAPRALSPQATATAQPSLSPNDMPTAVPLWTSTLTPQPSQTPVEVPGATDSPATKQELDPSLVAVVNGAAIVKTDYLLRVAQAQVYLLKQPGFDPKGEEGKQELQRLRDRVLDWMIDQILIEQEAEAQGITISEAQVDTEFAKIRGEDATRFNKWLAANALTVDTLRQQIRMDLITAAIRDSVTASLPRQSTQIHIRHILFSEESVAKDVLRRLREGQDFVGLARQFSEDEMTRGIGGDLGFIPQGVMPPAFEQAAFALEPGEISDLVSNESGFYIIQLVEKDPARYVEDELWPMVQQRAFEEWLAEQRAKANIQRATEN